VREIAGAPLRIGVVGFSKPDFDHAHATALLEQSMSTFLQYFAITPEYAEVVSGLTDAGVPRIAYQYAVANGMKTVGISASKALHVASGVFKVNLQILEGAEFGDESERFIDYIDVLIRIGGGPQSRREAAMFVQKCAHRKWQIALRLVEHELPYFKKSTQAER
jgi:hypothetical protein